MRWSVEVTGKAAHSSMPHLGVNAITYAARLLGELARMEEELEDAAAQSALRSALHQPAGDRDRRRHGLQHRAGAVLVRLGDPAPAGLRCHRARPAPAHVRGGAMPARDAAAGAGDGHRHRDRQRGAGLRGRCQIRPRPARPETRRTERHLRRLLRHRSQPVPGGRRAVRRHRPRQHRPGPHAQRISARQPSWRNASPSSAAWRTGRRREFGGSGRVSRGQRRPICPASPMCVWR